MTNQSQSLDSISQLYENRKLYTSKDMFSPPAERLDHVIRFELTTGCSWGGCTYCNGYDGIKPSVKSIEEYMKHVDSIFENIGWRNSLTKSLQRVFIGGGNALSVEGKLLVEAIDYTVGQFANYTGFVPKRIALYGRTNDILKNKSTLQRLSYSRGYGEGIDLIYWGVESGSNEVLEYVNKGYTQNELIEAADTVNCASIKTSVMIMPGLGGKKYYEQHIAQTANVLAKIRPAFLTFMGINPAPTSAYAMKMNEEEQIGENRPLTDLEKVTQMIDIIDKMPSFETKIGCFDCEIDAVGHNPLTFGSKKLEDYYDKRDLVYELRNRLRQIDNNTSNERRYG